MDVNPESIARPRVKWRDTVADWALAAALLAVVILVQMMAWW